MLRHRIVNYIFLSLLVLFLGLNWLYHIQPWTIIPLLVLYWAVRFYGSFWVSSQFFVPVYCKGQRQSGAISITFDDGPLPGKTEKILGILRQYSVTSAFFCIGNRIEKSPELVKQIHDEGHIIGNHTFTHSTTFDLQSRGGMRNELKATDDVLNSTIRLKPRFFRPPYGIINPNLAHAIREGGYVTVGWSVRSFDTITKNKTTLFNRVARKVKAGDIVLFHDYCDSTIEMLPDFLEHVSKLGLKVVRVDQLLNESPYV